MLRSQTERVPTRTANRIGLGTNQNQPEFRHGRTKTAVSLSGREAADIRLTLAKSPKAAAGISFRLRLFAVRRVAWTTSRPPVRLRTAVRSGSFATLEKKVYGVVHRKGSGPGDSAGGFQRIQPGRHILQQGIRKNRGAGQRRETTQRSLRCCS